MGRQDAPGEEVTFLGFHMEVRPPGARRYTQGYILESGVLGGYSGGDV